LLIAVALISTVLAYLAGITALRHLAVSAASVLSLVEPVVATIAAWVLLSESLSWPQVMGAAGLLGGALLVQLTAPGKEPATGGEPLPAREEPDPAPS
jgi:drug/metabolite transporter (DMT)-like permease